MLNGSAHRLSKYEVRKGRLRHVLSIRRWNDAEAQMVSYRIEISPNLDQVGRKS